MGKIIVVDQMLQNAYGVAFSKMEEMKYLEAEKIFDYVKKYNYVPDLEMLEYAYVIIYSNTHRVEKAIRVCEELLSEPMINKDLEIVVRDIKGQLENDMASYTVQDNQAIVNEDSIDKDKLISFLDRVKPSAKKTDDFLDTFALNEQEEKFYREYFLLTKEDVKMKREIINKRMSGQLKHMIGKYLSKVQSFEKVLQGSSKNGFDTGMTLLLNLKDDLLFYFYLHKLGLVKKIISNKDIALPIKNFMLYQMYILYINKMITNIKLELVVTGNKEIDTTIKAMSDYYERESLTPLNDYVELVYNNEEFTDFFIENMELKIESINSNSFPMFFPNSSRKLEFYVGLLYFISIYEYQNQFNDIIGKVYKIKIAEVQKEIDMLKMMLLFMNKEENNED